MPSLLVPADLLVLLAAIPTAALGGASFLKGVIGVATWLRVPRLLVATTLAAAATSSPELAVSSLAAVAGEPEIGLGDALGSNVVNLGLVLGLALAIGPLVARREDIRRDLMVAFAAPIVVLLLALDGLLTRADGAVLLTLFTLWLALVAREALTGRRAARGPEVADVGPLRAWVLLIVGLAALILAGRLFVSGASGIAHALGVHPFLVGAIVVAIGTSLPEIVTVLLSRLRGHDDVGLGTLLGSNLFNGLAIIGVTATIHPIRVPRVELMVAVAAGLIALVLTVPKAGSIPRWRGLALLATWSTFIATTLVVRS